MTELTMKNKHTSLYHAITERVVVCLCTLLFLCVTTGAANAQQNIPDPDWPCIQVFVPEVALAVIWPEFIEEETIGKWRKDKAIKKIVNDFGSLELFTETDRDRLADFAESVPEEERIHTFNMAADGILHRFNQRRSRYFNGIRKYTRQQIDVADQIEAHLNELVTLTNKTDEESLERKKQLEDTTAWQQRIFDRRESAIRLLCETPVDLETLLGDILRDLAQYLP